VPPVVSAKATAGAVLAAPLLSVRTVAEVAVSGKGVWLTVLPEPLLAAVILPSAATVRLVLV